MNQPELFNLCAAARGETWAREKARLRVTLCPDGAELGIPATDFARLLLRCRAREEV